MTAPVTRHGFSLGDVELEVLVQGKGSPVILLPSLGRPAEDFDHLSAALADAGYCALRPQPRGIGGSSGPMHGLTLHHFANDLFLIMDAYSFAGQAVVVGHAFGNFVARATAADYPYMVKAVVLLAATHTWPLRPDLRDSINKSHQMNLPEDERLKHLRHVFFAPGNDARVWLDGWHEDVMHMEREATEATPKAEWWSAGSAPILDVLPECDPLSPPDSRDAYVKEFGASRVTTTLVPNAAHALLPEQPEAVARVMLDYLKKIDH